MPAQLPAGFGGGGATGASSTGGGYVLPAPSGGGGGGSHNIGGIPGSGWLAHQAGQIGTDIVSTIRNLPTGLELTGKAVYDAATGNWRPLEQIGKASLHQYGEEIRHPFRHTFNTFLDATMFAGGVGAVAGRVAEVGRVASAAAKAGQVGSDVVNAERVAAGLEPLRPSITHAVLYGPRTEPRVIRWTSKATGKKVEVRAGYNYSRNPTIRAAQKQVDRLHERFPDKAVLGLWRPQAARIFKSRFALRIATGELSRAEAQKLVKNYGKLPDYIHEAVAIVHRGVDPRDQLDFIRSDVVPSTSGATRRAAEEWATRTEKAIPYLDKYELKTKPTVKEVPAEEGAVKIISPREEKQFTGLPSKWLNTHLEGKVKLAKRAEVTPGRPTKLTLNHKQFDALRKAADNAATSPKLSAAMQKSARSLRDALDRKGRPAEAVTEPAGTQTVTISNGGRYILPKIADQNSEVAKLLNKEQLKELETARNYAADVKALSDARGHLLEKMGPEILDPVSANARLLAPKNIIERRGIVPDLNALKREIQFERNVAAKGGAGAAERLARAELLQREYDHWTAHQQNLSEDVGGEYHPNLDMTAAEPGMPHPIYDPELAKVLARIPEVQGLNKPVDEFIRSYRAGKVTVPSDLTHAYTGELLSHGLQEPNVAKVVAASYLDAARFLYLTKVRQQLLDSAVDTPDEIPKEYALPIRTDYWSGSLPPGFNFPEKLMNMSGDALTDNEAEAGGRFFRDLQDLFTNPKQALEYANEYMRRQFVEPSPALKFAQKISPQTFRTEADLATHVIPGIKWIDRRWLGGLEQKNPLWFALDHPAFRKFLKGTDMVNEVQKMMVLYLKPSYLLPNMLGNVALQLVHQGFLAPANMVQTLKSLFTGRGLDRENVAYIKAATGGGYAEMFRSNRTIQGRIKRLGNRFAVAYGAVIDDPFRFSAFLHEARVAGFKTNAEIKALFTHPALEDQLNEITIRANDALINYSRLTEAEQSILRRLVFFYPWLKGSTRYSYQMVINHPVTAGAFGQLGQQGAAYSEEQLGPLPPWLEGLIPVAGGSQVVNPASAQVFGTPADLAETVKNMFQHRPIQGIGIFPSGLSPVDQFLLTFATGHTTVPVKAGTSDLARAWQEGFGTEPWWQFAQTMIHGGPSVPNYNTVYPTPSDPRFQAALRYLFSGGLTPRDFNKYKANIEAWNAAHPSGYQT